MQENKHIKGDLPKFYIKSEDKLMELKLHEKTRIRSLHMIQFITLLSVPLFHYHTHNKFYLCNVKIFIYFTIQIQAYNGTYHSTLPLAYIPYPCSSFFFLIYSMVNFHFTITCLILPQANNSIANRKSIIIKQSIQTQAMNKRMSILLIQITFLYFYRLKNVFVFKKLVYFTKCNSFSMHPFSFRRHDFCLLGDEQYSTVYICHVF